MKLIKRLVDWFEDLLWTRAIKDVFENPEYYFNSVDTLRFVLEQYQKVICECTGCQLSKLSYDASTVISAICDRCTDEQQLETEDKNI